MSLMDAHISIETEPDGERSLLPDGWSWEDKRSSVYTGLSGEETLAAYRRRIRRLRVLAIVGVLVFLAGALASIFWLDSLFWYLLSLAGCIASAAWFWSRASLAFLGLADLVYLDCDPTRYRFVLERVGGRHGRGEGESLRTLELAYCDYLEGGCCGRPGSSAEGPVQEGVERTVVPRHAGRGICAYGIGRFRWACGHFCAHASVR